MRTSLRILGAGFLLGVTLLAGCGEGTGEKVQVSGKVTVNGKALKEKGYTLQFFGYNVPEARIAVNDDGSFSGEAFTGTNAVELVGGSGHDASGKNAPKYSSSMTFQQLQVEVKKGEPLNLDFKKGASVRGTSGGH
jgi:hypothetical protein